LNWKNAVLVVPADNAIKGGFDIDGQPLYICRTTYRGNIILGKARPDSFGCAFGAEGKELGTKNYELLIRPLQLKINWVSNKDNPKNIFIATNRNDHKVYVGRCLIQESHSKRHSKVIGRVEHKKFYFTFSGKEYSICETYEILTCH
jgi:hypothetical protein